MAMHEDQLAIDEDTVRKLVAEQFPEWTDDEIREVATAGTVNAIFRIGDDLAARFALRAQDPARIWRPSSWACAPPTPGDRLLASQRSRS